MARWSDWTILFICFLFPLLSAGAQTFPTDDPVIKSIWKEAMDSTQLPLLAHELLDVIGPRLTGTPGMKRAQEWAMKRYRAWGIESRSEEYGTWRGWERGTCHVDLLEPRIRTLEGTMLAWSPGTGRGGVTGEVLVLPECRDSAAFQEWLPRARGKFILLSQSQPSGRPEKNWEEFARKASLDSLRAIKERWKFDWERRILATGFKADTLPNVLESAGAAGVLLNTWTGGWGTHRVFGARTKNIPVLDLSVED